MSDEGLELLKAFVEFHAFADGEYEFPFCFYCGSDIDEGEPHTAKCLRARARAYLRDQGVELEDDDE